MSSYNKFDKKISNFCMGYATPTEAIDDVKRQIDKFLSTAPKNIKELANAIENSLTYESECEANVNEDILLMLLKSSSFLKLN